MSTSEAAARPAGASALHAGILWMVATTLLFVTTDSIAKVLVRTYPPMQVTWAYFAFQVVLDPPPQGGREILYWPRKLTPSPSMGEGWGGGVSVFSASEQ